jgi:hypothetical protein
MVRLVFRPYTQVRRSICTSEPLRASIRVSSDFTLLRYSSPSFGSLQMRSYSELSRKSSPVDVAPCGSHLRSLSFRPRVYHPKTRAFVELLGPCFKTGRLKPFHQRPTLKSGTLPGPTQFIRDQQVVHKRLRRGGSFPKAAAIITLAHSAKHQAITVRRPTFLMPFTTNQSVVGTESNECTLRLSITSRYWIQTFHFRQFHVLFDSLFKVLFIFPSRYLFAIGLTPVFSFRRYLPPT